MLSLGQMNKIQMTIYLMDENLLQVENVLTKTLSFNFLIQTEAANDKIDNTDQTNNNANLEDTILTLEEKIQEFKDGLKNRIIDENITLLKQRSTPLLVDDCKRIGEEISTNINTYNRNITSSVNQIEQILEAMEKSISQPSFSVIQLQDKDYNIDSDLLLNVLKESFIEKVRALLPTNIILTKINLIASLIDGVISDTNCLNITRELKKWDETHLLNLTGTNPNEYYYSRGFLLVQVKTSHYANLDKIIYFPNPAISKEIAENNNSNAQFLVIKNTTPSISSLNFLITELQNLTLSKYKNKWRITPIFLINNSYAQGMKAEFIKYVQRGSVYPSIERTDYRKVLKEANELQRNKMKDEINMETE